MGTALAIRSFDFSKRKTAVPNRDAAIFRSCTIEETTPLEAARLDPASGLGHMP